MEDTKTVAVALIQNERGEYLLVKLANYYKECEEFKNAWCPPAGHVKKNESVEETLIRELKEELKLDIKPIKLVTEWEQDLPGEKAVWWECKIIGGELKKDKEIEDYNFFSKEETKRIELWPATKKFFEKFIWEK